MIYRHAPIANHHGKSHSLARDLPILIFRLPYFKPMPDLPLPLTFRAELLQLITEAIGAGECCALVGVGSSGKSNVVRFLRDRADAREHYFGDAARKLLWIMVDCNALDGYDEQSLFTAMIDSLARTAAARTDMHSLADSLESLFKETAAAGGGALAYRNLHRTIELIRALGDYQFAFVLDDCDALIQAAPPSLLRRLRALRDDFKYKLVYITVTRRELHRLRPHSPEFESFFEIIVVRSFAIGPYAEADARFMLDRLSARLPQPRSLSPDESHALTHATGGHGGMLKAAFFATHAGDDALDLDLVQTLTEDSSVMDECRKIWESLEEEDHAGLIEAVHGEALTGQVRNSLMAKALVFERTDNTHAVFAPVFENYVRERAGLPMLAVAAEPEPAGFGSGTSAKRPSPPVEIYQGSRLVRVNGTEIPMSQAEFNLLCLLYEYKGEDVMRENLLETVLAAEMIDPSGLGKTVDSVLDVGILELKQKLEAHGFVKPAIMGIKGGGYRMS
jgi:Transcriptional regulatory protein, C terminal